MKTIYVTIVLGFFWGFGVFSKSLNIPVAKVTSINGILKSQKKLYFCPFCPSRAAEILILKEWSFTHVTESMGKEVNLFINNTQAVSVEQLFIQEGEKWVNLGSKLGLQHSSPKELPIHLYPKDPEKEALEQLTLPSEISYMTKLEKEVFDGINLFRTSPKKASEQLSTLSPFLEGNVLGLPNRVPYIFPVDKKNFESFLSELKMRDGVSDLKSDEKLSLGVKNNHQISTKPFWANYAEYIDRPEFLNIYEIRNSGLITSNEILVGLLLNRKGHFQNILSNPDYEYLGISCILDKGKVQCKLLLSSGLTPPESLKKDLQKYETKSNLDYLTEFEKEIIEETNLLRTQPKQYLEFLKQRRVYYKDKLYKVPKLAFVSRVEGLKAVDEAIAVLEKQSPLPALDFDRTLSLSSSDHVKDTGRTGIIGHYGTDRSDPAKRISKYRTDFQIIGENIAYGIFNPRDVVLELFIDDGVYDRGHRKALLDTNYKSIGVQCGSHKTYRIMCVQNFALWK
jgi:hypothetical protein